MKNIFSKNSLFIFLFVFGTSFSYADGSKTTASYIVPTEENLVEHSRFEVEIVKPYTGVSTAEISYIFPKALTGDPGLRVDFKRISGNEDTGVSLWEANEMTATCTDNASQVQCNVYLKRAPPLASAQRVFETFSVGLDLQTSAPLFDTSKAKDFLKKSGLPQNIIDIKLDVLDKFLSSEPAGILSYEY